MAEKLSEAESGSVWDKLHKAGLVVGVALVGVGFVFGVPGLVAGGLVDFGIVEPNLQAARQSWQQTRKKRG